MFSLYWKKTLLQWLLNSSMMSLKAHLRSRLGETKLTGIQIGGLESFMLRKMSILLNFQSGIMIGSFS
jgi:hypothetical protein